MENKSGGCRIGLMYQFCLWERKNLPFCKTNAGYHLFLFLSMHLTDYGSNIKLKNIYHSLPFSEKTLRTSLRDLEGDGWIEISSKKTDSRHRDVVPTKKFNEKLKLWSLQIDSVFK